ncbi:hypothetical protein SIN8267_02060 [Sinobacterium norvegicum]|uniref:Uncharacterized protein n=1 Tax=Sinobacterium norvegicum TaxID=1641715 RepID=A0ABN8EJM9_9GAMM|nr:hypothetical protein [Sinobacterium norvegicum]CAH0991945.1 hypothetical protein SIN8267_02060 [Sinobacterium norvegicum]
MSKVKNAVWAAIMLLSVPAMAEVAIVNPPSTMVLKGWSGISASSDIIADADFCIISTGEESGAFNGDYRVKAFLASEPGARDFYLRAEGANIFKLPFSVYFKQGGGYDELSYDDRWSDLYNEADGCGNGGVSLRLAVSQSAIKDALPGNYRGNLILEARNFKFLVLPGEKESINIALNIPRLVQISDVKDMRLTPVNNSMTLRDRQNFCVYSTGGHDFSITASSLQNGFQLQQQGSSSCSGNQCMDYQVQVDYVGDQQADPGEQLQNNVVSSHRWPGAKTKYCRDKGNNMALTISADQANAAPGVYRDTLTLTVRPD